MTYDVVLASGVQQSEPAVHLHIFIIFKIIFPIIIFLKYQCLDFFFLGNINNFRVRRTLRGEKRKIWELTAWFKPFSAHVECERDC